MRSRLLFLVLCACALAGASPAQGASTWQAPQPLTPGPIGGIDIFAATGTDGSDAAGWFRFETGTSFFTQMLSVASRGSAFPEGSPVSGQHYYFHGGDWAANTRGDVVWAYTANDTTEGTGQVFVEAGVRPAGGAVGSVQRIATFDQNSLSYVIRAAIGPNGEIVIAWLGRDQEVWAAMGQVGQGFSPAVRLTQEGHRVDDRLDIAAGVGADGDRFVAWRDVTTPNAGVGADPGQILVSRGTDGSFGAPVALSAPGENALGPISMAANDTGQLLVAWRVSAALHQQGRGFLRTERHGLQAVTASALDPDGVAFIAGPVNGVDGAFEVSARPTNGRFLAPQRVNAGGTPRIALAAPARGAGVLAWSGTRTGENIPVRVAVVGADGRPGEGVVAATPSAPVMVLDIDVLPDGTALLVHGEDVGQPFVNLFATRGSIDFTAPESNRLQFADPAASSIRYRVKGLRTFSRLGGSGLIPDGSEIDAGTRGLDLTVAAGAERDTLTAAGTRFRADQAAGTNGITELRLTGPLSCPRGSSAQASRHTVRHRLRKLRTRTRRGKFRSRGRYAAATVRGTAWTLEDRCDRTTVRVTEGSVSVRDLVRKRTVTVNAGRSYTARKR